MKRVYLLYFILFLYASGFSSDKLLWPTDASFNLTATFGEYRPGHFHTGIDIKTWGREGYKVFAVDDGYVEKVSVSPYGYGKVLFFKLNNGNTAVFAHLSAFSDRIVPFVTEVQLKKIKYSVNVKLPEGLLRFKKGDVIGYTGSSGTGYPHLHFEIRDSLNRPVNPLNFVGSYINDVKAPVITSVAAVPLDWYSRINFDVLPCVYDAVKISESVYTVADTITLSGSAGLSVSVFDIDGSVKNKCSVYSIHLLVDDNLIFSVKYDTLSFDIERLVNLDRNYFLRKRGFGNFNNLFSRFLSIPFITDKTKSGILICGTERQVSEYQKALFLQSGYHNFKIKTEDFFGNCSYVTGVIYVPYENERKNNKFICKKKESNLVYPVLDYQLAGNNIRLELRLDSPLKEMPFAQVEINSWVRKDVDFFPIRRNTYTGFFTADTTHSSYVRMRVIIPDKNVTLKDSAQIFYVSDKKGGNIVSQDGIFNITIPENGLYSAGLFSVRSIGAGNKGFRYGKMYKIIPDVPLQRPVRLCFFLPENLIGDSKTSIYRVGKKGNSMIKSYYQNGALTAFTRSFGEFTVLRDTLPPVIFGVSPAHGQIISSLFPEIFVKFKDDLSGVSGERNYIIRIDRKRQIAEYDPEQHFIRPVLLEPLKRGKHEVRVFITDRAGNATHKKWIFFIR